MGNGKLSYFKSCLVLYFDVKFVVVDFRCISSQGKRPVCRGLELCCYCELNFRIEANSRCSLVVKPLPISVLSLFLLYNCIVPLGFFPREIRVAFPGESQMRQGRATQPTVHAGWFSVSIFHHTLTWTTGSFTCAQM